MGAKAGRRRAALVRNVDAGLFLENFLVAAVAAIVVIRVYLELAGYPQIGGGGLHIAHMLWGGLLMLVALILLLAFLGRGVQHVAAIVGGAGFGTFIDELGKFITSDNDYFFRPTFALIYAIFILLFLTSRAIERRRALSEAERLANALDLVRDAALSGMDAVRRDRALQLLERECAGNPLAEALREALLRVEWASATPPGALRRLAQRARAAYHDFVRLALFHRAVVGFFIFYAAVSLLGALAVIVSDPQFTPRTPALSLEDVGQTLASFVSAALAAVGVVLLPRDRTAAYHWFKRSILVSIFLVQFFAFYTEQLVAFWGLLVNLILLVGLETMIAAERAMDAGAAGGTCAAGADRSPYKRPDGQSDPKSEAQNA